MLGGLQMLGGMQIPDDEHYATLRDRWCTDYSVNPTSVDAGQWSKPMAPTGCFALWVLVERPARHANLNELICRSLVRAGIPTTKEPTGLRRTDGKTPDGLTLIPWRMGRALIWDARVTDTMAASYLSSTAVAAAAAAEQATDCTGNAPNTIFSLKPITLSP